ncbi:MAG: single-stranded-DNA-specific exonuclease RecJ [Gemmatimonadota bacterium]
MSASGAHAERTWRPRPRSSEPGPGVAEVVRDLALPPTVARFLAVRGLTSVDEIRAFLRPRLEDLGDPHRLADLPEAIARLSRALDAGETIFVHGDYDVDGMCGAALYARTLRRLGAAVVPFVPHRTRDGYDLSEAGVERAVEAGASVLLTVDCGSVAHQAVALARERGLDVIVTDHHQLGPTLPPALAVVNPARADCRYGEPLCGSGVAFKVCEALVTARGGDRDALLWELDLVALATVADLVPLAGENRVLARYGMRVLANTRNAGLAALLRESGVDPAALRTRDLSHALAPRLNAVGRLEDAAQGLALLLGDPGHDVHATARALNDLNRRRQELDRAILEEALEAATARYDVAESRGVVVAGRGWHPGVIGIVASRLVERLHRPTFVLALPDGEGLARGSGRSIPGFDLVGALAECAPMLHRFGGHAMAAGLDMAADRVEEFRSAFEAVAERRLGPEQLVPTVRFDADLPLPQALEEFAAFQPHMEPFGMGNPTPTFLARQVSVVGAPRVVGSGHLRLRLLHHGSESEAIGFDFADEWGSVAPGTSLDVLYQLRDDHWRGRRRTQVRLVDLRAASAPDSLPLTPSPGTGTGT